MLKIGAFEAKAKLAHPLDRVEAGEEIIITRRGRAAARLVPAFPAINREQARVAAAEIRAMSRGVTLGGPSIRDLIDEGRR